ncbi:hypothetical protein [Shewanella algae]|uniref:hypothetical protein n=1 Tax=Shewanella algae TaxID=38313 RepID=UPI003704A25C
MVAVAYSEYEYWLKQAKQDEIQYKDPLERFIFHHCQRLYEVLSTNKFVIERIMPNQALLLLATEFYRHGAMINTDDACKAHDDPQLYYQFSYALIHLMGHSDKRSPTKQQFAAWLSRQPSLEFEPEGLRRVVNG